MASKNPIIFLHCLHVTPKDNHNAMHSPRGNAALTMYRITPRSRHGYRVIPLCPVIAPSRNSAGTGRQLLP
jgi:hypothetical protein